MELEHIAHDCGRCIGAEYKTRFTDVDLDGFGHCAGDHSCQKGN